MIKFYIRNATLNEAIRSQNNITHLIATLVDDWTDKDISNSVLKDLNVLIAYWIIDLFEENETNITSANTKSQMNLIDESLHA